MMCYRDMTFCQFYEDCEDSDCGRAMTPEITEAAERWWGKADAPIAMFVDKPDCHKEKK